MATTISLWFGFAGFAGLFFGWVNVAIEVLLPTWFDAHMQCRAHLDLVDFECNLRSDCYCSRAISQPSHSIDRSANDRFCHSCSVSRCDLLRSSSKFALSLAASAESMTARFTSSFQPKERWSMLVEPTMHQRSSTIMILAWIMAG